MLNNTGFDQWADEDEIYFVADELHPVLPQLKFVPFSPCAGILSLRK